MKLHETPEAPGRLAAQQVGSLHAAASPGSRETELWVIHKMLEKAIDYDFDSCYNDD